MEFNVTPRANGMLRQLHDRRNGRRASRRDGSVFRMNGKIYAGNPNGRLARGGLAATLSNTSHFRLSNGRLALGELVATVKSGG